MLNGTTIPGLASHEKDKLADGGLLRQITTGNNTDQQRANSSVLYGTRSGARTQARSVARRLNIADLQRLDADDARSQRGRRRRRDPRPGQGPVVSGAGPALSS